MNGTIKLKKGDTVQILSGKDKGKSGKIIEVMRIANKVVVEGVNIHHRFERKQGNKAGQKVSFPGSLPAGKVMLICPSCGKPTRIGSKFLENGTKQRVCKNCGKAV